jgi:hypothetical protein
MGSHEFGLKLCLNLVALVRQHSNNTLTIAKHNFGLSCMIYLSIQIMFSISDSSVYELYGMYVLRLVTHTPSSPFARSQLDMAALVEVVEVVGLVAMVGVVPMLHEVPCPMPYYLYSFKLVDECKPMSKHMLCFVF